MASQQEKIDLYHSGDMSPEQMLDFEKQLASNPELKAESDFQSDIINGLKEVRKAELKARLNAIEVSPSWMEFAQQSMLVKSFGGVALATLIGSGVYLYAEEEETLKDIPDTAIEINAPLPQDVITQHNIILTDESNTTVSETVVADVVTEKPSKEIPKEEIADNKVITKAETSKEVVPVFSAPSASLIEDENKFESSNLDELPEVTSSKEREIDVSTENVKSVNVRYKYYDGKLFLSGDFDRAPYEILEINSAAGRRIYIQYLDKYYQVKTTDKLSDLPEVTNEKLIQELKLLKESK